MLDLHQFVDGVVVHLCAQINEALDGLKAFDERLVVSINEALAAVMESKEVELVTGPTSVKRIRRDANGNLDTIEEYGTLAG